MSSPIIPWMGGKRRLANRLILLFPPHECYVEVFAGGGALHFLRPQPAPVEVLNDINDDLVTLYHAFGGKVSGQSAGTATTSPAINLLRIEENLSAAWQRLSGTYVENLFWLECAERYDRPHTFHYMYPHYWQTAGYGVNFPFTNYERKAEFMWRCKGKVMISINDHPDIRRVFEGFHLRRRRFGTRPRISGRGRLRRRGS